MHPSTAGANLPALRSHNAALLLDLLRTATLAAEEAPDGASGPDRSGGPGDSGGRGSRSPGGAGACGGLSRQELAERTGLTPQAVSKIVARLRADGLVEEAGRRPSTGGKPGTGLRLAARAGYAVGVHLDGETLSAVLTDLAGRTVAEHAEPLDLAGPVPAVLDAAAARVAALAARAPGAGRTVGVGVGMRGPLDHRTGVLHRVTGYPHWAGVRLRDALERRLALPVAVDKDTNAAALSVLAAPPAPARSGPAGESLAYLHLGAGLGAALVLDGTLYRGGRTGAGEFGHQAVDLDGPRCTCGNRGCLEALCRAAAASGDRAGAARLLGIGAANLVALLDVDRVVLGGRTVAAAPHVFTRTVSAVLAERGRPVPVAAASPLAVPEGAALLALTPLFTRAALPA